MCGYEHLNLIVVSSHIHIHIVIIFDSKLYVLINRDEIIII